MYEDDLPLKWHSERWRWS